MYINSITLVILATCTSIGLNPTSAFQTSLIRRQHISADCIHHPHSHHQLTQRFSASTKESIGVPETSTDDIKDEGKDAEGLGAWIPLGSAKGLLGLGPQQIKVMGMNIVVWHTPGDQVEWSAQVDACTHRLAPLSQGRVNPDTKCIECPYHGWQYGVDGTLSCVPQLEKSKDINSIRKAGGNVKNFPTHVVGDIIFAFLPSGIHGEMFPQSLLPEEYYPTLNAISDKDTQFFVRELPYSFDFLVENFMDPAHIPFAHHKLQSTRDDATSIEMAQITSNFTHLELAFKDRTGNRDRDAYASFQRPSLYHFGEFKAEDEVDEVTGKKGRRPSLNIFCVPVEAGRSRLFLSPFKVKLPIPTFLIHAGSNRFLNTDTWLHDTEFEVVKRKHQMMQEAEKDGSGGENDFKKLAGMDYIYASQSDLGVSQFRTWMKKHGLASAPPDTFSMATMEQLEFKRRQSRREQIDPWESHAKHCAACRQDLKNLKRGQTLLLFAAIVSTALSRSYPILGVAGAAVGLLGHNFLKTLATTIEGNPERSGVDDRSVAASAE